MMMAIAAMQLVLSLGVCVCIIHFCIITVWRQHIMITKACWICRVFCSLLEKAALAGQQDVLERSWANDANAFSLSRLRSRGNGQRRTPEVLVVIYLISFVSAHHHLRHWLTELIRVSFPARHWGCIRNLIW